MLTLLTMDLGSRCVQYLMYCRQSAGYAFFNGEWDVFAQSHPLAAVAPSYNPGMISQGAIFNLSDIFISVWELERVVVI